MSRVRTPTRIQMEAAECGAVALGIVLEYYGHRTGIEPLRIALGVSRDGTSAGQIARTAQRYGLAVRAMKADLDDLAGIAPPAILHWEFNHFVVYEGRRGDTYYLNDPAVGPRRLTRTEMDAAFTGVVLVPTPGAEFRRTPPPPSLLALAWQHMDGVRAALWISLVVSLAMVLPNMLVPTLSGIFTDRVVIDAHRGWLWPLIGAMLLFGLTRAWTLLQRGQQMLRAQTAVSTRGALGFLRHAMSLPVDFFYHRFAAEVAGRLRLSDAVAATLVQTVVGAGLGLVCMTIYAAVMLSYDVGLTLLAMLFAGIALGSLALSQRLLADGHRRVLVEEARRDALVSRNLAGIEESAAAGTHDLVFDRIVGQHALVVSRRQAAQRSAGLLQAAQQLLATLGLAAVLIKGGYDIMDGLISVGMMVSFQGLLLLFSAPLAQLLAAGVALQDMRGSVERIEDVTGQKVDPVFMPLSTAVPVNASTGAATNAAMTPAMNASTNATPRGRIDFRGVSFGYSAGRPAQIEGLDLTIEAGSSVAIVGASGCGKSTLARMLVGQLAPTSGDILLDGESLLTMPRAQRFAVFAHVDQDVRLFSGSVLDNLTLWDESVPGAALRAATADAAIDDMIAHRPGQYRAIVAEAGVNMSGGERQRIDLARALARDAAVLVLDEATSALDPPLERVVLRNVLARGRTLVFISHRLAPLELFDRVIVMQRGRIVQDGTFEALMRVEGPLRRLVDV